MNHSASNREKLMQRIFKIMNIAVGILLLAGPIPVNSNSHEHYQDKRHKQISHYAHQAQLGPRPFFLVNDMDESPLKKKLQECAKGPFKRTNFSIGHRGAPLQFPEHTKESYEAAAHMGAGIIECDVTFTADGELVCRHAQCDLHTTTNILKTPLAEQCADPFTSATIDPITGKTVTPASAKRCTSDLTVNDFKTLQGKMEGSNPNATTVEEYMQGTPNWRTDLYASRGTLMTHAESIELFKKLGVKMTPELKEGNPDDIAAVFGSQEIYAQKLINEYKAAGVKPRNVYPQSFNEEDVLYWIENEPEFGQQAVYLDGRYQDPNFDHTNPATWRPNMEELVAQGVKILAPPMWMLVASENGKIVPSTYALAARAAGLGIITWTFERSPPLVNDGAWYHQTTDDIISKDGDKYETLDVLAKEVGILGIFTDWPATVTYYANCIKLN
jgi:glycerophosphoryl diester phosphodiesterase